MVEKTDSSVTAEVKERLEYFFGEGEEGIGAGDEGKDVQETSPGANDGGKDMQENLLRDLKALVLSIDWEITDEIMGRFIRQIGRCEEFYKQDKDSMLLLQLLGSLGKYLKASGAKAHPNAVKVMKSVYEALEKAVVSKDMPQAEREKMLLAELARFKELKQQIVKRKAEVKAKTLKTEKAAVQDQEQGEKKTEISGDSPQKSPSPDWNRMTPHEAFGYALEEVKQVIKMEFQALRAELRLWREAE